MPAGREKLPSRRKHSFGGCKTCRRRHVKCDQIRPVCLACRAINVTCGGYEQGVKWLPPANLASTATGQLGNEGAGDNTTRHHLFSVSSRASMSQSLRQCLKSNSVDASLAQIETRTGYLQTYAEYISAGPFGVLNMAGPAPESTAEPAPVECPPIVQMDSTASENLLDDQTENEIGMLNVLNPIPSLVDWFDPNLGINDSLQWSDLFSLEFDAGNSLLMPQFTADYPEHGIAMLQPDSGTALSHDALHTEDPAPSNDVPSPVSARALDESCPFDAMIGPEQRAIYLAEVDSPTEAQFLLKHFYDFIIPGWSFMPSNAKSPWTVFQLSEASRSLSEMTFLQTGLLKRANAANLYGILACSAYHLSVRFSDRTTKEPEYWTGLFTRLRRQANVHMQMSLREELKGPVKAKYKDQLMAILAMLACATISGHHEDARRYIIDAERLVRVKGLAKGQISRKCRVLHHVYSWIRVVGESTYVLYDYAHYGSVIDNMSAAYRAERLHAGPDHAERPPVNDHNPRLDDFLRLEPHQSDSDLDIEEPKGDTGLHDIHLNDSRRDQNTMYNEIYGISETWLSLVSQTTRLANILDAANYGKSTDSHFLDFLHKRSSRLEHIICSWAFGDLAADEAPDGGNTSVGRPVNHHMIQAMNSALVILFYRRIRNVNPLILQGHVSSVVQSLRDYDEALLSEGLSGPGSAWPAFIAGCEALSHQNRTLLMAWLDKGFDKCGLETFNIAMKVMNTVWDRQKERMRTPNPGVASPNQSRMSRTSSDHHTWVEVCREQGAWVTLY
ncbi:hypothetical protein P171DRAFT_471534 [Karstenula rhodostoma CBS 690.94]|uniref:Zn(2)-C6 fungal-type domain-containing protein n=1 Tax=Karstenula rhodostoma CBS 690.94 TaxID=1392251 RepID=A0A9P4PQ16_9PLEO|nr:hypothetical protein P171DRAFT_471534 [Karstenula rhodostoma CBS 690.94]